VNEVCSVTKLSELQSMLPMKCLSKCGEKLIIILTILRSNEHIRNFVSSSA
jgi:hypothetical protein